MNLLNKLTIKNLKLNKKRTIVTIIGIILSTALITGVATLVTSFRSSIINYYKEAAGDYHYKFEEVPYEELKYIANNRNVDSYFVTQNIGYSLLNDSKNEYKPYLYLLGFEKEAFEYLNLDLIEGRMPKKEDEVVISYHIESNGKVEYKVGDKLKLNIGKRLIEENGTQHELNQNNPYVDGEFFVGEYEKEYKIVGIVARPTYRMEAYSAPGYTIMTYINDFNVLKRPVDVYAIYKDLGMQYKTTSQILDIQEEALEARVRTEEIEAELTKAKYNYFKNETLIQWEILEFSDSTVSMLFAVATIIILIIIVTSVYCIKNSFEISITERIKQYGMLASIGATSKQIRKNVLYEGFILGIIGIPLGIVSGLLAIFILLKVIGNILSENLGQFIFIFSTSIEAIIISVILCSLTIYLSAKKSAKKASKITPLEAIRGSEDIKIQKRKFFKKRKMNLKTPKIVKKLFGIGGDIAYKNLKRNKTKYRTTVISIIVSVATFIPMTTFFSYAFSSNDMYYVQHGYDLVLYPQGNNEELRTAIDEIINQKTVEKYSLFTYTSVYIKNVELESHYSQYYEELRNSLAQVEVQDEREYCIIDIIAVGEQEYARYIKKLGLKYDDCKDKVILIDNMKSYVWDQEKETGKYVLHRTYDYETGDKLNIIKGTMDENGTVQGEKQELEIIATTDERPIGLEGSYRSGGYFIVSDEWMQENEVGILSEVFIDAKDAQNLENYINEHHAKKFYVNNYETQAQQERAMWLVMAIFLYGFITVISLIGVTNIFNTITTNMKLRSKEFANLKSVGMTQKEFNRMIRLESIFYCTKSLIFGTLIGSGLSYLIYKAFAEGIEMGYLFPFKGIIIASIAVALLITVIMQYSVNKINKQNIIETIRKDNI